MERHQLTEQIFGLVRGLRESKRLLLKSGTFVDATIIDAPPSTKNEAKTRDPEMKSGKKNAREWHFGMKAHVGTDTNGLVHTLVSTDAGASEFKQLPKPLHGKERVLYGDRAYWGEFHRVAAQQHGVRYRVNRVPTISLPPLCAHLRRASLAIAARLSRFFARPKPGRSYDRAWIA